MTKRYCLFQSATDEDQVKVWNRIVEGDGFVKLTTEGLDRVVSSKTVFIEGYVSSREAIKQMGICGLKRIPTPIGTTGSALALPKDSQFTWHFSQRYD